MCHQYNTFIDKDVIDVSECCFLYFVFWRLYSFCINNIYDKKSPNKTEEIQPVKIAAKDLVVVKIGVKITTHLSANVSAYILHMQDIFFDWKKHGCLEPASIANCCILSLQQSRKTTESEDAHANEGRQKIT